MKRKKSKTRAKKTARVFATKKRRGKEIYDIKLPAGHKTREQLSEILIKSKLNVPTDTIEGGQVKISLIAKRYNAKGSISLIHDIDDKKDLRDSVLYTLDWIFRKLKPGEVIKSHNSNYLRPGNPMNNYINRVIIDFETND